MLLNSMIKSECINLKFINVHISFIPYIDWHDKAQFHAKIVFDENVTNQSFASIIRQGLKE